MVACAAALRLVFRKFDSNLMPKLKRSYSDARPKEEVLASFKLACVANDFEVVEAGNELLAKKSMGLSSWPITLSLKVSDGGSESCTQIDLFGEIGGGGPIQASHLRKNVEKIESRAGLVLSGGSQVVSVADSATSPHASGHASGPSLVVPLSEKPLGFVLAVLGGLPASPVGIFLSPAVLFLLGKKIKKSADKPCPNRFIWWAAIGIIGIPLSFGINSAMFPGIYDSSKSGSTSPATPSSSLTAPSAPAPAPAPVSESWDSPSKKAQLEQDLVENWANAVTGVGQFVKSADCKPASAKNFWTCSVRFLGEEEPAAYKVEVDEKTGNWAAQPIF